MITITNNNIYYSEESILFLPSIDNADIINPNDILLFLSDTIELGEDLIFKRLFDIISYNVDSFNDIFYSSLDGYLIDPYLQEIENEPTYKNDIKSLEIYWNNNKYDGDFISSPSIHGVSDNINEYYALDFISLNNIKKLKISLNNNFVVYDYTKILEDDSKIDSKIELGDKPYTLFDLYNAIFSEITFHGGPLDKIERFAELEKYVDDEIDTSEYKNMDISTLEDLISKYENDDIYLVKYKNIRLRVDESRITIKENVDKIKACLYEKLIIFDTILNSKTNLKSYYKKLTNIEYNMQILYGEEEDISYHKFWETPKCTCPKINNIEIYPSKKPIFNDDCPIHGKK